MQEEEPVDSGLRGDNMSTFILEKDAFRVDTGVDGKRRLIRCKGSSLEKRQCWLLSNEELKGLYLCLRSMFQEDDPSEVMDFAKITNLKELSEAASFVYGLNGNKSISFKVHLE